MLPDAALPDWVDGDSPYWGELEFVALVLVGAFVAFSILVFVGTQIVTLLSILFGGAALLLAIGVVGALLHYGAPGVTFGVVIETAGWALNGAVGMLVVGGILYIITALWAD
jgi:hypothetical protein